MSWEDKKILVTGSDGFVGRHLVEALRKLNSSVVTLTSSNGSVVDFDLVNRLIKENNINLVFHLAAKSIVELGQEDPLKTFEVNIKGTWNILEASRLNKVKKVIIASTVHVYGGNQNLPFEENLYPQPSRPYETSKACADLLAQCYADSFGLSVEIPRFVNIYGPGDLNFTRIIPKIIKTILNGQNPKLWDVGVVRDFLYIDDAIQGYLDLANKELEDENRLRVFNFGSDQPKTIVDLVQQIVDLIGNPNIKIEKIDPPKNREDEVLKQYVSSEKAKKELGWKPKFSYGDGLNRTIDWYRNHLKATNG